MNAEEFNRIFDAKATEYLVPLGFKKKGTSYYIIENENILSFKKGMNRNSFTGFLFCYGHTFLAEFKDAKGNIKIPGYPENYPLTIDCLDLTNLITKHDNIADFNYEFNFMKRPGKLIFQDEMFDFKPILQDSKTERLIIDEKFIEDSVILAKQLGLKYLRQLTPGITSKLLSGSDSRFLKGIVEQIKKH